MAKTALALLLQSIVIGMAREIYTHFTIERPVTELILKEYVFVPEPYRQIFRNCRIENDQTYVEFARPKEQLFDR